MKKAVSVMIIILATLSCAQTRKLQRIGTESLGPVISTTNEEPKGRSVRVSSDESLRNEASSKEGECVMNAVMGEDGEMVATDVLQAAITVSTFRNVAERKGFVDLKFDIIAPSSIIDGKWQLRFVPYMKILQDTLELDSVYITGEEFRKVQLAGYARYQRYADAIKTDPSAFVDSRELEIYLQRHPESGEGAAEHYTDKLRRSLNERRILRKDEMFSRYVKNPIPMSGLRLDTVMVSTDSMVRFNYVQSVESRPGLKKAELVLEGEILSLDGQTLSLPQAGPLTFYISSLSGLAQEPEDKSDSLYMKGFTALQEHRYREALSLLASYSDFNTALSYCALEYNDRAMEILQQSPDAAKVEYVKAILYSRMHKDELAREMYLSACRQDGAFVHRGNLDPEISRLKNKYNIN